MILIMLHQISLIVQITNGSCDLCDVDNFGELICETCDSGTLQRLRYHDIFFFAEYLYDIR